jgi:hypothetical protein
VLIRRSVITPLLVMKAWYATLHSKGASGANVGKMNAEIRKALG